MTRGVAAAALVLVAALLLPAAGSAAPPSCVLLDRWYDEGDTGVFVPEYAHPCTGAFPSNFVYRITTADGTAVAPDDYGALDMTAGASAGQNTISVVVQIVGDTVEEPDETFTVTVSDPSGTVTFADDTATITILDDDGPPRPPVTCTVPDLSLAEGTSRTPQGHPFQIACDALITDDLSFRVATADGTATAGDDYLAIDGPGSLLAGQSTINAILYVVGDTRDEPDETFTYSATDLAGEVIFVTGTITILDDDEPGSAPCVLLSETSLGVTGTASTPTTRGLSTSPRFTVENCSSAAIGLDVRGTDATGPAASWELTNLSSGGPIDSICELGLDLYRAAVNVEGGAGGAVGTSLTTTATPLLGLDGVTPLALDPAATQELSPQIELPCEGSSGLGDDMSMQITFTAVAP